MIYSPFLNPPHVKGEPLALRLLLWLSVFALGLGLVFTVVGCLGAPAQTNDLSYRFSHYDSVQGYPITVYTKPGWVLLVDEARCYSVEGEVAR